MFVRDFEGRLFKVDENALKEVNEKEADEVLKAQAKANAKKKQKIVNLIEALDESEKAILIDQVIGMVGVRGGYQRAFDCPPIDCGWHDAGLRRPWGGMRAFDCPPIDCGWHDAGLRRPWGGMRAFDCPPIDCGWHDAGLRRPWGGYTRMY